MNGAPDADTPEARRAFYLTWLRLLMIVVGCVAAVVLVRDLDRMRLLEAFRAMGPWPVLMGVVGGLGVTALQTLRWSYVTRPIVRVRFRDAFATLLVGGLFNSVLPARGGDVLRVQYLSDRTRASRATLLGTEIVDFWADKAGWMPAFLIFATMGAPPSWMYKAVAVMGSLALALLVGLVVVRARRSRSSAPEVGFRARLTAGLLATSGRRLATAGLCLGTLPWIWETLIIGRAADAAGITLAPFQAFALLTAFNIATVVPTPANLGMFEAASVSVLTSFGVSLESALTFAVLYHASQLLPYLVGGSVALLLRRRRDLAGAPGAVQRIGAEASSEAGLS